MERISSTEFQKAYPRLTEPHEVTALGRVIGVWYPAGSAVPFSGDHAVYVDPDGKMRDPIARGHSFGASRPAPKPGKKP